MEKNSNTSSFSICRKIRQVVATNPAFRAIHHIKQYYREPRPTIIHSNSPSPPPPSYLHQKNNVNKEGEGVIPTKFDSPTTPISMGNGNSSISRVHGHASKVASPHVGVSERTGKVAAKVEYNGKSKVETQGPSKEQHSLRRVNLEQQGKKSMDINDTFTEYIQRAKYRIRTVSNVGHGQSNPAKDEANGSCTNKVEIQKDHFSDFIHQARKKIRTTSNIGKTSSLKRG